jgi:hypothetical protein
VGVCVDQVRKGGIGRKRMVFLWRRKVGIGTRKVGVDVVVNLTLAGPGGVSVGLGRVRNGGIGGMNVSF